MSGESSETVNQPDTCVRRCAEQLLTDYASEYQAGHLTWRDFEHPARRVMEAAASLLRERAKLIPPPSDDEPYSLGFSSAIEVLTDDGSTDA